MPLIKISYDKNLTKQFNDYYILPHSEDLLVRLLKEIFGKPEEFIMFKHDITDVHFRGQPGLLFEVYMTPINGNDYDSEYASKSILKHLVADFTHRLYQEIHPDIRDRTYLIFHHLIEESMWSWNGKVFSE